MDYFLSGIGIIFQAEGLFFLVEKDELSELLIRILRLTPKMFNSLECVIHPYCQLWIKVTLPQVFKCDSTGDRLSKNRKSCCWGNIDYKILFFKAIAHSFKRFTAQFLKLSFSLYAPFTSDECHV